MGIGYDLLTESENLFVETIGGSILNASNETLDLWQRHPWTATIYGGLPQTKLRPMAIDIARRIAEFVKRPGVWEVGLQSLKTDPTIVIHRGQKRSRIRLCLVGLHQDSQYAVWSARVYLGGTNLLVSKETIPLRIRAHLVGTFQGTPKLQVQGWDTWKDEALKSYGSALKQRMHRNF